MTITMTIIMLILAVFLTSIAYVAFTIYAAPEMHEPLPEWFERLSSQEDDSERSSQAADGHETRRAS